MTYVMTRSKRRVCFDRVDPRSIDLDDIAYALAHTNRYAGHIGRYSVAEHSVHVMRCAMSLTPDEQLAAGRAAICHDMAEAYTGDIPTPLKVLLRGFREVEARLDRAIQERFDLDTPSARVREIVHTADRMVTHAEARHFLGDVAADWARDPWPKFRPWGWWDRRNTIEIFLGACEEVDIFG